MWCSPQGEDLGEGLEHSSEGIKVELLSSLLASCMTGGSQSSRSSLEPEMPWAIGRQEQEGLSSLCPTHSLASSGQCSQLQTAHF